MAGNHLSEYVERVDRTFGWEEVRSKEVAKGTLHEIELASQKWRGIDWKHRIRILVPEKVERPEVVIMVTGSGDGAEELAFCKELSRLTGMAMAILHDVPNQPLFGSLYEDALMAHTFARFIESGEPDWPLLFPMVKSVVRAMDCVEDFMKGPRRFIVTGASKRGWTSWLTAAVDGRVKGIAPMVYDNLNIPAQMRHQIECYGAYSEQISDYTELGLIEKLNTDVGKSLVEAIDPYCYRQKLGLPKLLINGTNDRFWTVDSLNIYFGDLLGEKNILYVPNSGHALEDRRRVLNSLAAFSLSLSKGSPMPSIKTERLGDSGISAEISGEPIYADVWFATSRDMDFRDSTWVSLPAERADDEAYRLELIPGKAFFLESCFSAGGFAFTLSSRIHLSKGAQ
ncbi:MAG: hypothetical protein JTT11_08525 [Candidatus Brockarchaeota archaeon]|nr:hypothetical protein [Candidatus Brockarchaeota archaeon]